MAMGFADKIDRLNNFDAADSGHRPLLIAGKPLGWLGPQTAALLLDTTACLVDVGDGIALTPDYAHDFAARSEGLRLMAERLQVAGMMGGFRDEPYRVCVDWDAPDLAVVDRRAIPHFGLRSFGIHVNGLVRTDKGLEMWIARRALDREVEPGKRDNMVAGGQPAGLGLMENLIKEAAEEAGIPADLARTATPGRTITYEQLETPERVKIDTIFTYDLYLPDDFVPVNTDGEVDSFERLTIQQVAEIVHDTDDFKPNCNLVIIEFLERQMVG